VLTISQDVLFNESAVIQPSPEASRHSLPRLRGIDGLRGVAAAGVMVFHVWSYSSPDRLVDMGLLTQFVIPTLASGVTLFFTLSGFLLYRPYAAAIIRRQALPSARAYARNRLLRIFPAYWVILLAVAVVLPAALIRDAAGQLVLGSLRDSPGILAACLFLVQGFAPSTLLHGIGPAWSVSVELTFYLLLPVLALCGFRMAAGRGRDARIAIALIPPVLLFVVGWAGKLTLLDMFRPEMGPEFGWKADWYSVLARSFFAQADLFSFGMIVAVLRILVEDDGLSIRRSHRLAGLSGAAGVIVGCSVLAGTGVQFASYDTWMALACGLLLACLTLGECPTNRRALDWLESRAVVAVGLASYSLFLWHEPLIRLLVKSGWTQPHALGLVVNLSLVITICGTLSWLTYRFVEAPALRLKRPATRAVTRSAETALTAQEASDA
jgi:peptidoglycan/LPS O-acetylase OafA/YrhL